ncbi:hypothetical protein [Methyloterricola oryzae]|uniref:hypothetical protein n=1 Tax=Methyloterricola oryzae TaxID=1495050 RepID=UPI00069BA85E|nr:hypothetical protein [Methyloterricola oryzae]
MIDGLMLNLIREACMNIVILAENTEEAGFARSIITREEIRKQLHTITQTAANLAPETRQALPKIDWAGWSETWRRMQIGGNDEHHAMWNAVCMLAPATLTWLRVYPKYQPDLFVFKPNTTACGDEPDKV